MFETVVPETYIRRSRRVFYETLPVSIGAHAAVVAAVVLGTIWNVEFPQQSPSLVAVYSLTDLPDPPPPPPPARLLDPAPKEAAPAKAPPPPPPPALLEMAPRVIPNLVPKVAQAVPLPDLPPAKASPEGVAGGSAEGVKGGKLGGEAGGQLHGLAGSLVFPDDGRVYVDRDEKLPLQAIRQEYPLYPEDARKKRLEDSVLVRYVIGKNGRVKDVTILDHAREPAFDEATVSAIKEWYFRPMKKDGKPVEVVHELTVFYQLR